MKRAMSLFLEDKPVSINTKKAYQYDIEQFLKKVNEVIDDSHLRLYEATLRLLKPTVQKRKISTVNQFLAYLYACGRIDRFYRLQAPSVSISKKPPHLFDLSSFWQASATQEGQLIALFIIELGLLPTEILSLEVEAISCEFQILTVKRNDQKRVLSLSERLIEYLRPFLRGRFLLGSEKKPYSRQWAYQKLSSFLTEKGFSQLTAHDLREQFILRSIHRGESISAIAKQLGLKSFARLERYL